MIPVLYSPNEQSFASEGLGRFAEAISCKVVEERNGVYELEMVYPANGRVFASIDTGNIILAKPNDTSQTQPFRIYKVTTPLNGRVSIYAQHISYDLAGIPVAPFSATGISPALNGLVSNSMVANPFTVYTDISNATTIFTLQNVQSFRACLGGVDGSILDLFSGSGTCEFEFDRYAVKVYAHRGTDNGVRIEYGKNLTELNKEKNVESMYTGVVAYWLDSETGDYVQSAIQYVTNHASYPAEKIYILDVTSEYEEKPTVSTLNTRAASYRDSNDVGVPKVNLKVSFVALWQTEEYKSIAPLERVSLCDTVTIHYAKYGVDATAKVIKTDYDVIHERYNSIELGDAKSNFSSTINKMIDETSTKKVVQATSFLEQAIVNATDLITGGDGGYVVINRDSDGKPYEILIMDTADTSTATNVIRMNKNGIGFSTTGYNGPFTTAWTIDGGFVADFITSGTINAIDINASDITGSVITFGSGSEATTMQTEQVTNVIDNPIASVVTTYLTSVLRGQGLEVYGEKVISLKSENTFQGNNYATRLMMSPYAVYLRSWDDVHSGNAEIRLSEDFIGMGATNLKVDSRVIVPDPTSGSVKNATILENGLLRGFVEAGTSDALSFTPVDTSVNTLLVLTGHNSTSAANTLWLVRRNSNMCIQLGGSTGTITVTSSSGTITVLSTGGNVNIYYMAVDGNKFA